MNACASCSTNCVPWHLGGAIAGHEVSSVIDLGWAELSNGALLDAMEGRFDVLVRVDKSVPYQQQIAARSSALIILRARSNRLDDLLLLVTALQQLLGVVRSGEVHEIGA